MKNFFRNLLYGYMLAIIVAAFININILSQISNIEFLKVMLVGSLVITPIMCLLIYAIKFAGIPLVNDFIEGSIFNKILILAIVITLITMKFLNG
ncbi:hypothetical protein R9X47_22700 [Wukongibacter baidiensis]|uniref:hypothetical protein n=1 Tax=Wukongibacter baidiensis TaxID=1723361 RepID=UPI003D7F2C02